jgi:hypothetical protein
MSLQGEAGRGHVVVCVSYVGIYAYLMIVSYHDLCVSYRDMNGSSEGAISYHDLCVSYHNSSFILFLRFHTKVVCSIPIDVCFIP